MPAESYWRQHFSARLRRRRLLAASLAGGVSLASGAALGCSRKGASTQTGAGGAQASPRPGGTLHVYWATNPVLDPQKGSAPPLQAPAGVMSRLFRFKNGPDPKISTNHDLEPDLAVSAESPDAGRPSDRAGQAERHRGTAFRRPGRWR